MRIRLVFYVVKFVCVHHFPLGTVYVARNHTHTEVAVVVWIGEDHIQRYKAKHADIVQASIVLE